MREELTLKELLGIILKQWRLLVVFLLLFGLLLGGYRVYSVIRDRPDADVIADMQASYEIQKSSYEFEKANIEDDIENLQDMAARAEEYNENSLLMKVDPYHKEIARISISIRVPQAVSEAEIASNTQVFQLVDIQKNKEDRILSQYLVLMDNVSLRSITKGTVYEDTEERYLREIVKCYKSSEGTITIETFSTADMAADELARKIYDYFQTIQETIASASDDHTLSVLVESKLIIIDTDLLSAQQYNQRQPATFYQQISDKDQELIAMTEPEPPESITMFTAIKSGIKYMVFGGVLGLCMGAVIAFLLAVMSRKATSATALCKTLDCRYLGNLGDVPAPKGLDQCAEVFLGEDIFKSAASQDRFSILAANLKAASKSQKCILLTGPQSIERLNALGNSLAPLLGNEFILHKGDHLLTNAQTIEKLQIVDAVVLVADAKTARIDLCVEEISRIKEAGKDFLGVIWL